MPVCNSKVFLCGLPPDCQEDSLKSFLEGVFEEFFNPWFSHNVIKIHVTISLTTSGRKDMDLHRRLRANGLRTK